MKRSVEILMRLAIFGCFLGHGTLAIKASNNFASEWSNWTQSLFPSALSYQGSQIFLSTVGAIDVLVALSFLLPEINILSFLWAIGWGAATAGSRLYFLTRLSPPYWFNVVHPVTEFLVRAPNWMVPLMLFRPSLQRRLVPASIYLVGVSLFLTFLVDLNESTFPYEIVKRDMPLWFFYLCGSLATLAVLTMMVRNRYAKSWIIVVVAVATSYFLREGFDIMMVNAPSGFFFAGIRTLEHFPIYFCLGYALWLCML